MPSNCGAGEDSWESLGQQEDQTTQSERKSTLYIHWKNWCRSWSYSTLATWCEQPTHWKRPWRWERLRAGGTGGKVDEMVREQHRLTGPEFEQTPRDSAGQENWYVAVHWVTKSQTWLGYWTITKSCNHFIDSSWGLNKVVCTSSQHRAWHRAAAQETGGELGVDAAPWLTA